jgi:uncharacterized protein YndB with AHSA1/START domain
MGKRIEINLEIDVDASPGQVWDVVADHEGMVAWMPVAEVVRRKPGLKEPNGVGAVRTIRARSAVIEEEITEFRAGECLAYRLIAGAPVRDHRGELVLTPNGEGCHLRWTIQCQCSIPLIGGWVERELRWPIEKRLERLKTKLDSR